VLALAGICGGVAIALMPNYFKLSQDAVDLTFRGGAGFAIILLLVAALIALRSNETPASQSSARERERLHSERAATLYPLLSHRTPRWKKLWLRLTERGDVWVSLRDAATELYNRAQTLRANDDDLELLTGWAEAAAGKPDDVLNYLGVYIAQTRGLPLRARRPPATVHRAVTHGEVMGYSVSDGATTLRHKVKGTIVFTDLIVKRKDVAGLAASQFPSAK